MSLSVSHLNFSASGGAGTVATRLVEAQRDLGLDSRLVSRIDTTLWDRPFAAPEVALAAAVDEFLLKNPTFPAPVSAARDLAERLPHPILESSDVLHLHGINGLAKLSHLSQRYGPKKIVWTLHDMNPFTGVCHFSLGCQKFTTGCQECPATRRVFHQVAPATLRSKKTSLSQLANLTIVAPSTWMAEQASVSDVMKGRDIRVLPNPVGNEAFGEPLPGDSGRSSANELALVVVAQDLANPRKNVSLALEAFSRFRQERFPVSITLIGRNGERFAAPGVRWTGPLSAQDIRQELSRADALIHPSTADNAPLVIPEAAAQGCFPVVNRVGGMPEMVQKLGVGSVFDDLPSLVSSLRTLASMSAQDRHEARHTVTQKCKEVFSASSVAEQYLAIYQN